MSKSKTSPDFVGLLPPQTVRPDTAFRGPAGQLSILRDQFTISTWLCIGAIVQGIAISLFGTISLLPATFFVVANILRTTFMTLGWTRNIYMDSVISRKFSAQFPNSSGRYSNKPADSEVVVFLIGTRVNHPLGLLAPGAKQLGDHFQSMEKTLVKHEDEFGMLGMRVCLDAAERSTGSEIVTVCYFRTIQGLHDFAHSEHHREGWAWYNRHMKQYPHLSVFHETYHVPKGNWEAIYVNSHPSGINSTSHKYVDEQSGRVTWASPVVDASKGLLRSSAGRMSRSDGTEHDQYSYA